MKLKQNFDFLTGSDLSNRDLMKLMGQIEGPSFFSYADQIMEPEPEWPEYPKNRVLNTEPEILSDSEIEGNSNPPSTRLNMGSSEIVS